MWAIAGGSIARAQLPVAADFTGAWFKPYLEIDEDPALCADALGLAAGEFFSKDTVLPTIGAQDFSRSLEAIEFDSFAQTPTTSDPRATPVEPPPHVVRIEGKPIYLARSYAAYTGLCGYGACSGYAYHASVRPLTGVPPRAYPDEYRKIGAQSLSVPEYLSSWLKSSDGRYFIGFRDYLPGHKARTLVRLTADGSWHETCRVIETPPPLDSIDNEAARAVLPAIRALDEAAFAMAGDGGCGSPAARTYRRQFLEQSLYRPWNWLGEEEIQAQLASQSMAKLELWAANGLYEHRALARYRAQRDVALDALEKFLAAQFRWPAEDVASVARTAVFVTDTGFSFPDGDPYRGGAAARALRRAILDHRPLEEIRAIDAPLAAIDGVDDEHRESALNAAVAYPEALQYLLDRGANPNRANAFGKTPLMYAAQQNAYESAAALLDHGADPNAQTRAPTSDCYYELSRTSVTVLHYAVRYASRRLVELLLEHGAAPVVSAKHGGYGEGTDPPGGEYPVHWLARYDSATSVERNPNIAPGDVPALKARLAPPESAALPELARQLTARAEREYSGGDPARALSSLRVALGVAPDLERALVDTSLVALRAGEPDEAARAAQRVIAQSHDERTLANAWFNYGLACDPSAIPDHRIECQSSTVYPFLRSWLIEPTPARVAKISEVMARVAQCHEQRGDGSTLHYFIATMGNTDEISSQTKIYVLRPARSAVATDSIRWSTRNGGPIATPALTRRYVLGDVAVDAYDSQAWVGTPVSFDGFVCAL